MRRALSALAALSYLACTAGCPGPGTDDTGAPDAPMDTSRCTNDRDCDDERYCNGAETCREGVCQDGDPVRCDDSIACTTDRCSESRRACEAEPLDADGDGRGAIGCADGDDCDDGDPARYPGNFELCDPEGHDEDCNPTTLGGIDEDLDAFESAACCNPGEGGASTCGEDCNDAVASVNPRAVELCNGRDDDCDGTDDVAEGLAVTLYVDGDRDGVGSAMSGPTVMGCASRAGYSVEAGDCDDATPARSPRQLEFCDMLDNDCDMSSDESAAPVLWYADTDGDGFGDAGDSVSSCAPIADRSLLSTDCDDGAAGRNPGQAELCNGVDDDCNGLPDALATDGTLEDDDLDGLADRACPGGTDCDDRSAAIGAGESETCDGRDNDCDTRTDEGVTMAVFYADRDGDGYGSISSGAFVGCGAPRSYVARAGDCADADPDRYPGAPEDCDGSDDDCDGASDEAPSDATCRALTSLPSVSGAACVAGRCAITCAAGSGDCDGLATTGCEANLLSDVASCGVCGRRCSSAGAEFSTCNMGSCLFMCLPSRADCNRDPMDGCETTLATDAANCGGCGVRCPSRPNTVSTCAANACTSACAAGFADCDGNVENGCETSGTCVTCPPGAVDCDGDRICEDLPTDPTNCGACGRVCGLGGACLGGTCDRIEEIAVGDRHTCVRRTSGQVVCWGQNDEGQVAPTARATGDVVSRPMPVVLAEIDDALAIAAGRRHTCAIRASGRVTCWGSNMEAQLGRTGMPGLYLSDVTLPGRIVAIDAGGDHTCVISEGAVVSDDTVLCWGANASEESAPGSTMPTVGPSALGEIFGGTPRVLSVGNGYSCYGNDADIANCWGTVPGYPGRRVFGTGNGWQNEGLTIPATQVTLLEAGGSHVCIATRGGEVYCRGDNGGGQLGTGDRSTYGAPVLAPQLFGARELWLGPRTTCARLALDRLRCVGFSDFGELGNGTSGGAFSDVAVTPTGLPRVLRLGRGSDDAHVCAVDLSGRTLCWGHNANSPGGFEHRVGIGSTAVSITTPAVLVPLGY